ncbi:MAG: histidinol-phosphatase HisJ family protein [Lachnospiraceae bacterium]|nr:histidinol-phosphatase HisJ family protein [Lachnospiraceae bacterium]
MQYNYHTHSRMCGHAVGELEEYVKEAISQGFTELGFSEHIPYPGDAFLNNGDIRERMPFADWPEYIDTCNALKEKYKGRISILTGFEVEYTDLYASYYERVRASKDVDYMILGQHFAAAEPGRYTNCFHTMYSTEDYIYYAKACLAGMETGMFSYLAHPDLFLRNDLGIDDNVQRATDMIINAAVKNDYILEVNANGFRRAIFQFKEGERLPYPTDYFWDQVTGTGIRVMIGSDCHKPAFVNDGAVASAEAFAADKKLHVIDRLPV